MSGYKRQCCNCGARLGFLESDPCESCQPYVDLVDGLLIPKSQAQSLYDFYGDEREAQRRASGYDVVARQPHEKVDR